MERRVRYCVAEQMSLEALAKFGLPGPALTSNELYREFFSFASNFFDCVRALQGAEKLPVRDDQTYRLWDAYRVLSLVAQATRTRIGDGFAARPAFAPDVFVTDLDETWWDPIVALRAGYEAVQRARSDPVLSDPATGELHVATDEERAREAEKIVAVVIDEERELAQALPSDRDWWRTRLRAHATLVQQLRESGRVSLARLCDRHLAAAWRLAEKRLEMARRDVRVLVGMGRRYFKLGVGSAPVEETEFLLTEVSSSRAVRAYDRALDALEAMLPDYNAAALPELHLDARDVQDFVEHLRQAGLEDWMTQLVAENWDIEVLWEMSEDQRISMVFGRVRTLCALLEEALLSFADFVGDADFTKSVESQAMLSCRLGAFLKGRAGKTSPVSPREVVALNKKCRVNPPVPSTCLETSLDALAMRAGDPAPLPGPDSVQMLAGLVFIRNLTSHRYPIVLSDVRANWFETWGQHLPAVNRTVPWSGLALWALTKHFR